MDTFFGIMDLVCSVLFFIFILQGLKQNRLLKEQNELLRGKAGVQFGQTLIHNPGPVSDLTTESNLGAQAAAMQSKRV